MVPSPSPSSSLSLSSSVGGSTKPIIAHSRPKAAQSSASAPTMTKVPSTAAVPSATPIWEGLKENAAPLERGRNVVVLEQSLALSSQYNVKERVEKERIKRYHEQQVRPSEQAAEVAAAAAAAATERGDTSGNLHDNSSSNSNCGEYEDPLKYWIAYIKFQQEAFPSDTRGEFLLMERCVRAFCHLRRYANDRRYVRICCLYAEKTQRAAEIFPYLYQQCHIGVQVAIFWAAWAFVAEKGGDYALAEQIFAKGLRKQAEPVTYLQTRQAQFQRRMSRHWLNSTSHRNQIGDEYDDDDDDAHNGRGALTSLSEDDVRRNDRARRPPAAVGRRPINDNSALATFTDRTSSRRGMVRAGSHNQQQQGFSIFVEGKEAENSSSFPFLNDTSLQVDHDRRLESEADRRKENTLAAERWNERGGLATQTRSASRSRGPTPSVVYSGPLAPFAVYVDPDCAAEHKRREEEEQQDRRRRQIEESRRRQAADERTLRERMEGDSTMAERLAEDPIRYLRDPTRFEPDRQTAVAAGTVNEQHESDITRKSASNVAFPRNKKLKPVGPVQNAKPIIAAAQEEMCLEERRMLARCYMLATHVANINRLCVGNDDSGMSLDDDDKDESMDVVVTTENLDRPPHPPTLHKLNDSRHSQNASLGSEWLPTPRNTSTASSTVDEAHAVGAQGVEPTINTQLALRELSMMFSSPAVHNHDGLHSSLLQDSTRSKTPRDSHSNFLNVGPDDSGFLEGTEADGSFLVQPQQQRDAAGLSASGLTKESFPFAGPPARCKHHLDSSMLLRTWKEDPSNSEGTAAGTSSSSSSTSSTDRSQRREQAAAGISSPVTFSIFQDPPLAKHSLTNGNDRDGGFTIFQDNPEPIIHKPTSTFAIYHDSVAAVIEPASNPSMPATSSSAVFTIYQDLPPKDAQNPNHDEQHLQPNNNVGDTASFSLYGDVMQALAETSLMTDDSSDSSEGQQPSAKRIMTGPSNETKTYGRPGETASWTEYGEVLKVLADADSSANTNNNDSLNEDDGQADPGEMKPSKYKLPLQNANNMVDTADDQTTFFSKFSMEAIVYDQIHQANLSDSVNEVKANSVNYIPKKKRLDRILATAGTTYDLPMQVLPRPLKQKKIPNGTSIKIDYSSAKIRRELGRGAYGVVVLLDSTVEKQCSEDGGDVAVKIQNPAGCLAWEYQILHRLERRLLPKDHHVSQQDRRGDNDDHCEMACYPFPKALCYMSLADGAMLSMTSASQSGVNLITLINMYTSHGQKVPEILAFHYTARMLHHLELLHWNGNILHCDVKPDNWVLGKSNTVLGGMEAGEVMLVDFGRAVDLIQASNSRYHGKGVVVWVDTTKQQQQQPREIKFIGNACEDDMMCVAMRQNIPWSFDIDTFGLCASAHVLLHAKHLELKRCGNSNRWQPQEPIKRYHQRGLWSELFDTLLNLDPVTGHATGSRPHNLRQLRHKIEAYVNREHGRLYDALRKQSSLVLPQPS